MKITPQGCKKIKAQKQKLTGISFYFIPIGLPDAAYAYKEMRFIIENEAHLRGKSMHCFLNSCASPQENISMFIPEDEHHFSMSINQPDRRKEHKDMSEGRELLKNMKPSPRMPINRAMCKG